MYCLFRHFSLKLFEQLSDILIHKAAWLNNIDNNVEDHTCKAIRKHLSEL